MKRFKLSETANADLEQIGDYIAQDNQQAAWNFVDRLEVRCQELAERPGTGRKREALSPGLRSATEGDYLIFYEITSYGIEVIRIIHGKRNIARIFKADSQ